MAEGGDKSQQTPEDPWAAAEGHVGPPPPPKWGQDQPAASHSQPAPAPSPAALPANGQASHPGAGPPPAAPTANGHAPRPGAHTPPQQAWTPPPGGPARPQGAWTPPPPGAAAGYAGSPAAAASGYKPGFASPYTQGGYPPTPFYGTATPALRSALGPNVALLLVSAATLGLLSPVGLIVAWVVALRRRRFSGSLLAGPARPWYFWALVWTILVILVFLIYAIVGTVQANNNSLPVGGSIYPWIAL